MEKVLATAYEFLTSGNCVDGMNTVSTGLDRIRSALTRDDWVNFCRNTALSHPLKDLLWQDPFTFRAFQKPRGYAGDAVMLDYIYGETALPSGTTKLGSDVFAYVNQTPAPRSVRERRDYFAATIDDLASRGEPRILSVACGHLREARVSNALKKCAVRELIALDQDAESLALIDSSYKLKCVRTISGSVRDILSGRLSFSGLNLIYASGLYDYLEDRLAINLTAKLFNMLDHGGRLIIANFLPSLPTIGYMEAYMGWNLIYRDEAQMQKLAASINASEYERINIFKDIHQNVTFLDLTRK